MADGKILVVDDEGGMCRLLTKLLGREGYEVTAVANARAALQEVAANDYNLVLTDIQMPEMTGLELLRELKEFDPTLPVVMITAYGTVENAVEALRAGAYDYVTKPFENDEIILTVDKALERQRLIDENEYLHQEIAEKYNVSGIVVQSAIMHEIYDIVRSVAPTNANVMITGESGTGKELIARSLHVSSNRPEKPFVVLNCAALSEGILESELFGHEKGAFSGAMSMKKGRFELAHQGTLFIDEVGEMSQAAQVKLLRVIQEHEFERVGGTKTIHTDVRIVAATNRNLEDEVKKGKFREDLYYRLNVINIHLPPLRDRREDIEPLAEHFLQKYARETGKKVDQISSKALNCLLAYDWPGNIRELQNALERAVVLCRSEAITPKDLPQGLRDQDEICINLPESGGTLTEILEDLERQLIMRTLRRMEGSQTRTAESLGIKRTTLRYKMEKYDLV